MSNCLVVPDSKSNSKQLIVCNYPSQITYGHDVDDNTDMKTQIWKDYVWNIIDFIYPNSSFVPDDTSPKIYFGSPINTDSAIAITCKPFQDKFRLSEKHFNMSLIMSLYEGLSSDKFDKSNIELSGNIDKLIRSIPDDSFHSSKIVDWGQVTINGIFDLELSTKKLINLLFSYLRDESWKKAVSIMNILGLKKEEKIA